MKKRISPLLVLSMMLDLLAVLRGHGRPRRRRRAL
jgi:hypothetical protein